MSMHKILFSCFFLATLGLSAGESHLEKLKQEASQSHKTLIIKATSASCHFCIKMDKEVLLDAEVKKALKKDFLLYTVDINKEALPFGLKANMTPTFFFVRIDKEHKVQTLRVPGAWVKSDFLDILKSQKSKQDKGKK